MPAFLSLVAECNICADWFHAVEMTQARTQTCFVGSITQFFVGGSFNHECRFSDSRRRPLLEYRHSKYVRIGCRMNVGNSQGGAQGPNESSNTWREQVRLLLDPSISLSAKSILAQDMAKRAPEISKEAFKDICESAGLEGVPTVVNQFAEDILPDLARNGPRYASEITRRFPELLNDAASGMQSGESRSSGFSAPTGDFLNALNQEVRNMFSRTPEGLETPSYETLERRSAYEIRRYPSMLVASARMQSGMSSTASELDTASSMGNAFSTLAKYLFGKNSSGSAMEMTTPVIMDQDADTTGVMSFIVPSKFGTDPNFVPQPVAPVADAVSVVRRDGGVYAVASFTGYATTGEVSRQRKMLLETLERDGVSPVLRDSSDPSSFSYSVLVYNGPWTVAFMRRNELCIEIEDVSTASPMSPPASDAAIGSSPSCLE